MKNAYFVIVAYDVSDDKRRQRVADALLDYGGTRVNYSVFECLLPFHELTRLKGVIKDIIDEEADRIIYYQLCEGCLKTVESIGVEAARVDTEPGLFV